MSILPETEPNAQDSPKAWRDEPCGSCDGGNALKARSWREGPICLACYDAEAEISTGRVLVTVP